jgi:predicted site-specific integrase-resolvase
MFLTLNEAIELSHMSRATIFRLIKNGYIERIKRPGMKKILFEKNKFEHYLLHRGLA